MVSKYTEKKYNVLNNGLKIPRVGFGSYHSGENVDVMGPAIKHAIKVGFRHIDTASLYGTEESIGKALKEVLSEGIVKREDLFITTKIWNDEKTDVEAAIKRSLQKLQLDYVDLYLIHWPIGEVDESTGKVKKQIPLHITWKAMEDQVKAGRAKSIGVSNFNVQILLDLLSYAEIKPVCNQIEVHPYLTQEDLVAFCQKNDIEVVAFCPMGGNIPGSSLTVNSLIECPVIKELAKKYNKTPAQVILNWHLSRGYCIIPKTSTESRVKENFECDSFEMSPEDCKKIFPLNKNHRSCPGNHVASIANNMFA